MHPVHSGGCLKTVFQHAPTTGFRHTNKYFMAQGGNAFAPSRAGCHFKPDKIFSVMIANRAIHGLVCPAANHPCFHFREFSGLAEWQAPFVAHKLPAGQLAHPQPQDDFPFLLPRTMLTITAATTRARMRLMIIVAIFSISHVSMQIPPFSFSHRMAAHFPDCHGVSFHKSFL